MLKSRLLGENPCDVDRLFRKIKQFGGHGRAGGGVSGIEMALWDLAGKAYEVPVYQLLGGKFRDKIRIYADTPKRNVAGYQNLVAAARATGQSLLKRKERGLTWLKCDVGIGLLAGIPNAVSQPFAVDDSRQTMSPSSFAGFELTAKGVGLLADYVAEIRNVIGMEIPLAIDHLGAISINSVVRLAKALEPYSLAWIEDPIPWQLTEQLREITSSVNVPILTGEDICLKDGFQRLVDTNAIDIIHPDIATAGGILETKKIGDLAGEKGIPMAIHCAGTPIQFLASVHCAAASEHFLCLEHHGLDTPWWESLVQGIAKPILQNGFVNVPEGPGLGIELNEEMARQHLSEPGFFEPTPEWNKERSWDRTWS
jgi:L-alanine-DL-glutamate epimerase-like enolase superfamily enzyme